MANSSSQSGGPYLSAAFLCEKILQEGDGVKSAIRIVDRVTHTVTGPEPPTTMEPFVHELTLFLRFKSGWARGGFQLRLELVKPSGDSSTLARQTVVFEGEEDRGADIIAPMRMELSQTGIYWFEVHLNEVLVTRVPFRVVYVSAVTPPASGATGGL